MYWPKKIDAKEILAKKNSWGWKIPHLLTGMSRCSGHFVGTSSNLEHYFTFPTFFSTFLTFKQKWSTFFAFWATFKHFFFTIFHMFNAIFCHLNNSTLSLPCEQWYVRPGETTARRVLVAWLLSWKCTIILLTVGTVGSREKKNTLVFHF